ncbi:MAG: hypothetical protein ACRD5F_03645, partial [Candidatus Acidiferrales bacterium]
MPLRGYSAFEHLAKSILLSRCKSGWWFMVAAGKRRKFTAYFDESHTDRRHPFPVVAGFLGCTDTWIGFDRKWTAAEPKGLSRSQRKKASRKSTELAEISNIHTLQPFYVTVERDALEPLFRLFSRFKRIEPMTGLLANSYIICAFFCCELVDEWATTVAGGLRKEHGLIQVVFDKNDEHWA